MFEHQRSVAKISLCAQSLAHKRQLQLTKPQGSLGQLEDIAVQFAGWQDCELPNLDKVALRVFAGDHGICAKGVSAFPQIVTQQMIHNFCSGGAAISVLAKQQNFDFQVWNMGTVNPLPDELLKLPSLVNKQVSQGTADFSEQAAMTALELQKCLQMGADAVPENAELFIGGEMGIGNTSSAAALLAALHDLSADSATGRGTGIDDQGYERKIIVIKQALKLHRPTNLSTLEKLQHLGGLEIAALVGAYISAAQKAVPILVDGFITTVAAAYAITLNPNVRQWMLFAHCSAEQAHSNLLGLLQAKPLLQLDMRLGEASGAATAVPLIKLALSLHSGMATFVGADVATAKEELIDKGLAKG